MFRRIDVFTVPKCMEESDSIPCPEVFLTFTVCLMIAGINSSPALNDWKRRWWIFRGVIMWDAITLWERRHAWITVKRTCSLHRRNSHYFWNNAVTSSQSWFVRDNNSYLQRSDILAQVCFLLLSACKLPCSTASRTVFSCFLCCFLAFCRNGTISAFLILVSVILWGKSKKLFELSRK